MNAKNTKIAIFIYSMAGGGAERVVSYLLPYIKNKGIDVVLVLMNSTIAYDLPKDIPIHYLETSKAKEHGSLKLVKLPLLAYKYARLLKKLEITHSFSLLTRPNYINVMSRWFTNHSYKLIISERNYISEQYGYGDLQSKINRILVRKLYPKADQLICNAKESGKDLVENYNVDAHKIKTIYNPIDKQKIDEIPALNNFFDPNYFNLISVGRLEIVKNHKMLLEVVQDFKNVRLYILGQGPLEEELISIISEKGLQDNVFLLGFDNNPYKYLKKADLFMFGSNHEGFPNVLLEAICCGLPILSTNCKSGPSEMLELEQELDDDIMITKSGILSPVGNVELMKKGLNYFLQNPEYLNSCKKYSLKRIKDFELNKILLTYEKSIFDS
ncbi:glycosyltransferase [Sediminicola luteus]|uniref:Glycosyltransferase n=1 Tax=Sediminicola luteus TaxID=319238 RepID=A0ABV2TYA5_9FLAO